MSTKIKGAEYPLSSIFSSKFEYSMPNFQRPYSWTEKQTSELLNDLYDFFENEDKEDQFFLGTMVLVKEEDDPKSQVIDGQQRLTTLTILFAVITSRLAGSLRDDFLSYIIEPGRASQGIQSKPRLTIRDVDQRFFNKYIQKINFEGLFSLNMGMIDTEAKKHIVENAKLIKKSIDEKFTNEEEIAQFGGALVQRCFLVVVSTPTWESAFKIFTVINDRGLDLLSSDIIKAEIIGKIPPDQQKEYTSRWEAMENNLSREDFCDLIIHTRMIYAKTKAKSNILEEFKTHVLKQCSPKELIDDILEPYSEAYSMIKHRSYDADHCSLEINSVLFWLNKVEDSDWMPTAIKFIADRKNYPEYVLWFVKKFERLVAYLYISSTDRRTRINRYKSILDEMEKHPNHCMENPLSSIELKEDEINNFIELLNGEIYKMSPQRRKYVVLRLNSFMSDGVNKFDNDPNIFTIEHVLPQNVESGSEWESTWPKIEVRKKWLNRIANLVALTRQKNSKASNFPFSKKKEAYFKYTPRTGCNTYPITSEVLGEKEWLPKMMENRQKKLINIFKDKWDLVCSEGALNGDSKHDESEIIEDVEIRNSSKVPCLSPELEQGPVGNLVYESLQSLINSDYYFSEALLHNLTDDNWTNKTFGTRKGVSFLKPVVSGEKEEFLDINGHPSYLKKRIFTINGESYYISKEWEEKSRRKYLEWYHSLQ